MDDEEILRRKGERAALRRAELDQEAVRLAVIVHVRHTETGYDLLPCRGEDRYDARQPGSCDNY
ncbi:MAG: DUF2293 domain-containing protein [bacterium]